CHLYALSLHYALPILLPRRLRARIGTHGTWVVDHVPPSPLHDDVWGRLLDDRCWFREFPPDPPGRRSGEAIHRGAPLLGGWLVRSEEHTSELQSPDHL